MASKKTSKKTAAKKAVKKASKKAVKKNVSKKQVAVRKTASKKNSLPETGRLVGISDCLTGAPVAMPNVDFNGSLTFSPGLPVGEEWRYDDSCCGHCETMEEQEEEQPRKRGFWAWLFG